MCKSGFIPKVVPHKHAAVIKAWADGAEIEVSPSGSAKWRSLLNVQSGCISWDENLMFRVKPSYPTLGKIAKAAWRDKACTHGLIDSAWDAAARAVADAIKSGEHS